MASNWPLTDTSRSLSGPIDSRFVGGFFHRDILQTGARHLAGPSHRLLPLRLVPGFPYHERISPTLVFYRLATSEQVTANGLL